MGRFRQATREKVKRNRKKLSRKSIKKATSTGGVVKAGARRIGRVLGIGKLGRYRR